MDVNTLFFDECGLTYLKADPDGCRVIPSNSKLIERYAERRWTVVGTLNGFDRPAVTVAPPEEAGEL